MNIPFCPPEVWRNLYDAAKKFSNIACWEWMSDVDVFGVQNPESSEIGYGCVLGQLGEVFGLVVYLGSEGLEQHRKIQTGKMHAGSPDFAYSQNCLTLWFGERSDLDKTDLAVVKKLNLKFRGAISWPQFRSLRPGYLPWYLTESEAKFLTVSLEQAREVALRLEAEPNWLTAPRKHHYRVQVPVKTAVGWKWESQWLKPAPIEKVKARSYSLDEVRLQRIKRKSQQYPGIWEIDACYAPTPVDGDDRPFFPYSLLCVDHDSGFIFGTAMAEPSTWQTQFPSEFLDCMENHKLLPRSLWLRKEELRALFAPLAVRLGIQVQAEKKLPNADRAKRAMLKFLAHHR
jgi:hypothetical protein